IRRFALMNEILDDHEPAAGAKLRRPERGGRLWLGARAVQVRLRFIAVLLAAFLVVGFWGNLRNYWDTLTHRFSASHAREHAVSADTEYFCPMDPGVISDWPAICPVCNMDLVRRKKGEAVVLPEGVVARMQFSPYRIQLAGIKTSLIRRQSLAREFVLSGRVRDISTADPDADSPSPAAARIEHIPQFVLECEPYAGDLVLLNSPRPVEISIEGLARTKPIAGTIIVGPEAPAKASGRRPPVVRIRLEDPPG